MLCEKVWDKVPHNEATGKILTMRWVDTRKADVRYRCRLLAMEIKATRKEHEKLDPDTVFSSVPAIEALKALVSHMMIEQADRVDGEALCVGCWDLPRAYLIGLSQRTLFKNLLEEHHEGGYVATLKKAVYGTQDAAQIRGQTWIPQLAENVIKARICNRSFFVKGGL